MRHCGPIPRAALVFRDPDAFGYYLCEACWEGGGTESDQGNDTNTPSPDEGKDDLGSYPTSDLDDRESDITDDSASNPDNTRSVTDGMEQDISAS